ncbi:MAG: dihydroneopterin aldolase [Hyphomicrobiales bacterium]|nr:dihydroneopterin aldolase [Hyphomicrobiales bacterium]
MPPGMPLIAKVLVEQLDVHAYHGWYAHEGEFGQSFLIDLEFETDIAEAARNDDLNAAINYGLVVAETRKLFVERRYKLLEAAAAGLADDLLRTFPTMMSIFVRIRKVKPPIPERLNAVGVELRRVRDHTHD